MKLSVKSGFLQRLSLFTAAIFVSAAVYGQSVSINPSVSSSKVTPITSGPTLNALQGTGSITYTFSSSALVSSVSEAYYVLNGERYDIGYTINPTTHNVTFSTDLTETFDAVGTTPALTFHMTYMPYSDEPVYFPILEQRLSATAPYGVKVWPKIEISYSEVNPSWGILSGGSVNLAVNAAGGNSDGWRFDWSDGTHNASSIDYSATNTAGSTRNDDVTVRVYNVAPGGTERWEEQTHTFRVPVYAQPTVTSNQPVPSNVVFAGTAVTVSVNAAGGNPSGWSYNWTDVSSFDNNKATVNTENAGTSATTLNPSVRVSNNSPSGDGWLDRSVDFPVTVWPAANATLVNPGRNEWINGETVPFSVTPVGGDASKWTYTWMVDGQRQQATGRTFNYVCSNTGSNQAKHVVSVTATNAPTGIDKPYTTTQSYEVTVYPSPAITNPVINKPVVYSGTAVTMSASATGGKPGGWTYSWTKDGAPIAGTTSSLTDTPLNTGNGSRSYKYVLTAVNTCGETVTTLTQEFNVTVWPTAKATLSSPEQTEWINGYNVGMTTFVSGGDASKWTFNWKVDGQSVSTDFTYNYTAVGTTASGNTRVIEITATNAPEGIDTPYTVTLRYQCTVYPTPAVSAPVITAPVIYNGDATTMSATVTGGKPGGWVYSWTKDGAAIAGTTTSLTDTPANTGNGSRSYKYVLKAVNTCGETVTTLTQDFDVTVWPNAEVTLLSPQRTEWINGNNVPFATSVAGGDASKWTYSWTVDGQQVSTDDKFDYTAFSTTAAGAHRTIEVKATNTPEGINRPYTMTRRYECTVYPTPAVSNPVLNKPVVFSGTEVSMNVTVTGGKPDTWQYSWTKDGAAISGTTPALTDAPVNTGTGSRLYKYVLTAVNTCDETVNTFTQEFEVTVWPVADATLVSPEQTEWIDGNNVALSTTVTGGDASKWTYAWTVDNQPVSTADAYTYIAAGTTASGTHREIKVTATNTPAGIDAPYTVTRSYGCTVYPTPAISNPVLNKPVVFSGTEVSMNVTVAGGKPGSWQYSWTKDGATIAGTTPALTDTPVYSGAGSHIYQYVLTAVNTCDETVNTFTQEFNVTVWPVAEATLVSPSRTEWIAGLNVPFSTNVSGGDASKWTYTWKVDNTIVSTAGGTFDYVAANTNAMGATRTIEVTAVNTPEGIDVPFTVTRSYQCIVYAQPAITAHATDKPVVFSGTSVSMNATIFGGKTGGWQYSWTKDGAAISGTTPALTDAPVNTGTGSRLYKYVLTAVNTCDETVTTLTQEFEVTVWPVADATLVSPQRTEWIAGLNVPFSTNVSGGDASKWTYTWKVDNTVVSTTGGTFDYVAANTDATGATRTIEVTAVNTPEGIDVPFTVTRSYQCVVYAQPAITAHATDKPVVFSGTAVSMNATIFGGKTEGWQYSWTKDDAAISGTPPALTDAPVNTGTGSHIYKYVLTAVNTCDETVTTLTQEFEVTVWPAPSAVFGKTLPDNIISGKKVGIPVDVSGGDSQAWTLKWIVDNEEKQSGSETDFDFSAENSKENESIESTVKVEVTNSPAGIDAPYTVTLDHTFTVWPGPSTSSVAESHIVTCARRTRELGVNFNGGQEGQWKFVWTLNGGIIDSDEAKLSVTFENASSLMRTDTYVLTVTNTVEGTVEYENTYEYRVDIYPEPVAAQGRSAWDIYYGKDVTLNVDYSGGYPDGWKFTWSDNLPDAGTVNYTVPANDADSYEKTITVTVTNGHEGVDWARYTYTFNIKCWSLGEITAIPVEANYNGEIETTLSTTQSGGYPDGWTYEWYLNDSFIADGMPQYEITETNDKYKVVNYDWKLIATNSIEGTVGSRTELHYRFDLWRMIEAPTSFMARPAQVRAGEEITLIVAPAAAIGGYQDNWNYEWTADGSKLNVNAPEVKLPAEIGSGNEKATTEVTYGLRLTNPAPDEGFWYNNTFPQQKVTVYRHPLTPTALERKGNGTTCTMIVLTDLTNEQLSTFDYAFVFGYTDASGVDHAMPAVTERYCRFTPEVYNNSSNDFWVYAQWVYENGAIVTSSRRHLSGATDNFDGSDFDPANRGGSAGLENVVVDDDEIYVDARGFKVSLTAPSMADVTIADTSGKTVFAKVYERSYYFCETFSTSRLVPGVYIVTVKAGDSVKVKKVVIK